MFFCVFHCCFYEVKSIEHSAQWSSERRPGLLRGFGRAREREGHPGGGLFGVFGPGRTAYLEFLMYDPSNN